MKKLFVFIGIAAFLLIGQTTNLRVMRFNNIRYCNEFPGSDPGAKINACIADLPSVGGIAEATGFNGSNTITTQIVMSGKPVNLKLHGTFTYTGAALTKGIVWLKGDHFPLNGASGSKIECDGYPQNIALEQIGNAVPCGFIYTPASGTPGPVITLDENAGSLNDVQINNLALVVNNNVSNPINIATTGGGAALISFNDDVIINSATNQGYGGHAINMTCANAGAAAGVQYVINFHNVGIFNNGTAINGNAGGSAGDGIYLDPTAGTGCGFIGPVDVSGLVIEGLTEKYGFFAKGALNIHFHNNIINSNNLATNGSAVHVENSSFSPVIEMYNNQFNDNNWSNTTGVTDVSIPGGSGFIRSTLFNGGTGTQNHAPDHAIDIGANVIGFSIINNKITNMKTYGTVVNTGTQQINYCGNNFSVGNGAAAEFQTFTSPPNKGCLTLSNGNPVVNRFVNNAFGARYWDTGLDGSGNYNIAMNGANQVTVGSTAATFTVGPIIPFNADSNENVPVVMDVSGNIQAGKIHIVKAAVALSGGTPATATITLTGNAVFTAAGTYICSATDNSGTQIAQVANTNNSTFVLTGNINGSVHQFNIICIGN